MKLLQRSAVLAVILALLAVCVLAIYSYELKRHSGELVRAANEFAQKGSHPQFRSFGNDLLKSAPFPTPVRSVSLSHLDAGCLTKLGGCSNIAEFFPKVWQQTSTHTIHCRIPNREGIVDKAAYLP